MFRVRQVSLLLSVDYMCRIRQVSLFLSEDYMCRVRQMSPFFSEDYICRERYMPLFFIKAGVPIIKGKCCNMTWAEVTVVPLIETVQQGVAKGTSLA